MTKRKLTLCSVDGGRYNATIHLKPVPCLKLNVGAVNQAWQPHLLLNLHITK